jgi:hypothetical protein
MEQIEEFIVWKGAFKLAYLLESTDDAPYKYEVYDILKFFFDNYKEQNGYILKYLNRCSAPMEETNALKEPMEEEIDETGSSLDDQEEEEWSYPCLPPNKSNYLTNTLFDHPPCLPKEDECYIDNCDDPTILELDMDCVLADHEKHALCDIYIVEFVQDATEIIMREENMVVGIFMLLKHLSLY